MSTRWDGMEKGLDGYKEELDNDGMWIIEIF